MRSLAVVLVAGGAVCLASCAALAGLGDYELAPGDASVADASDGSVGDVTVDQGDGGGPGDVVVDTTGAVDASDDADSGDGGSAGDSGMGDSGNVGDDAGDGGARTDGPELPPTDPGRVLCGPNACNVALEVCCEKPNADTCQSNVASCPGGVVAHCDEAANCQLNQVCCVTAAGPSGLETSCHSWCQTGQPQACHASAECTGGSGPCVTWSCAGGVVGTCGGVGSSTGGQ